MLTNLEAVQEYAHSTLTLHKWGGEIALGHTLESDRPNPYAELSYDDFMSAIKEMLRTDPENAELLDLDNRRFHPVNEQGQATNKDGQTMAELITRGKESSRALAAKNPAYEGLAVRDAGDELIARRVDALKPGETLFALSHQPTKELLDRTLVKQEDSNETMTKSQLYRSLGYRKNLSYLQYYSRGEHGVTAGSHSIDFSDENTWREILKTKGVDIPAGTDPNLFIRYSYVREADPEEAEQMIRDERERYYEQRCVSGERFSVSEYVDKREDYLKRFFNAYYPSLAEAVHEGHNNQVLRGFARGILETDLRRLKDSVKDELRQVAEGHEFTAESAKTMDSVIRYAVVEELRKDLKRFTRKTSYTNETPLIWPSSSPYRSSTAPGLDFVYMSNMNERLAMSFASGISAGRSYGGCPAVILVNEGHGGGSMFGSGEDALNPQHSYGGSGSNKGATCEYVIDQCPKCETKKVTVIEDAHKITCTACKATKPKAH